MAMTAPKMSFLIPLEIGDFHKLSFPTILEEFITDRFFQAMPSRRERLGMPSLAWLSQCGFNPRSQ